MVGGFSPQPSPHAPAAGRGGSSAQCKDTMSTTPSTGKRRPLDIVALLARWLLGGLFIYLGVSKVLHRAEFLRFLREQLSVTDLSLSSLIATIAPWLEVVYGLWLFAGKIGRAHG